VGVGQRVCRASLVHTHSTRSLVMPAARASALPHAVVIKQFETSDLARRATCDRAHHCGAARVRVIGSSTLLLALYRVACG